DDVTYTLDTIALYKGEPDVSYAQEVQFTTRGNYYLCGVELEIGVEYLIGLSRKTHSNTLTAETCDLVAEWSSVSDEDKASVE
ncbi:unnamed protein product, partial [Laminaria digitata]